MTILVTGGCGFIGTNFISNWFQRTDEHIVNIDCMTYAANTACLDHPPHKNLTNLNVDITDSQMVGEVLRTIRALLFILPRKVMLIARLRLRINLLKQISMALTYCWLMR